MSALELYLKEITKRKRIRRVWALQNLRSYMKQTSDEELTLYIKRMTNLDWLKILWEAGLRTPLQRAVSIRIEELARRRGA